MKNIPFALLNFERNRRRRQMRIQKIMLPSELNAKRGIVRKK